MTPLNSALIEKGMAKVSVLYGIGVESLADERIVDYICYHVYRLREVMVSQRAVFSASWYFSDNAIQKYYNQFMGSGNSKMMYFIDRWLMDNKKSRSSLTRLLKIGGHSKKALLYLPSEDPVKLRMHNKPEGYSICQMATTGWCPVSMPCTLCNYSARCHEDTKKKYPELTRLRENMK